MPTIKNVAAPYHLFFYSFDCNKPPRVHVQKDNATCKFWLNPLALAKNYGFSAPELNQIRATTQKYHLQIVQAWDGHCSGQ
jgi:hypothetical protein